MTRNLDNRVEAVTPVEDPRLRRELKFNLDLILADNVQRWTMNPDGSYEQQQPEEGEQQVSTQETLMRKTTQAVETDRGSFTPEFPTDNGILVEAPENDG
jgi:polyphosphate kinase